MILRLYQLARVFVTRVSLIITDWRSAISRLELAYLHFTLYNGGDWRESMGNVELPSSTKCITHEHMQQARGTGHVNNFRFQYRSTRCRTLAVRSLFTPSQYRVHDSWLHLKFALNRNSKVAKYLETGKMNIHEGI